MPLALHRRQCADKLARFHGILLALVLVFEVILSRHRDELERGQCQRLFLEPVEAFLAVLAHKLVRVLPVWEHDHADVEPFRHQDIEPADGRVLACRVAVVGDVHVAHIPFEQSCLLLGQCGSKARYGVRDAGLVEPDDIGVPLDHHQIVELSAFLKVQAVEVVSLVIQRRVAGVDVFRFLLVVEHARAEADHATVCRDDRENHSPAIRVIGASGVRVPDEQARLNEFIRREAPLTKMLLERFPFAGRIADPEALDRIAADVALLEIRSSCHSAFTQQRLHIEPRRELTSLREAFALCALLHHRGIVDLFGHRHSCAVGELLHCLMKRHMLHIHDELDHRAADMAAKAIIELFIRRNGKRGSLLAVYGTKSPESAPFRLEFDIGRDDRDDIVLAEQFVHPMVGICHMPSFPLVDRKQSTSVCNLSRRIVLCAESFVRPVNNSTRTRGFLQILFARFFILSFLFSLEQITIFFNQVVKSIHDFGTKMRTYSDTA